MKTQNLLVSLVAIFALVLFVLPSVIAVGSDWAWLRGVGVNGNVFPDINRAAVEAGEPLYISVDFNGRLKPGETIEDVIVTARIRGEPGLYDSTDEFDVVSNGRYIKNLRIDVPYDIDPTETFFLEITIESASSRNSAVEKIIRLDVQRANDELEILSIGGANEVNAGDNLMLDVVLKNRGLHEAEDTYVTATITELGISKTVYFGDLTPEDDEDGDKFDSEERLVYLNIPSNVLEGLYTLEIEAFNTETSTVLTKKVFIGSAADETRFVSSTSSKTFAVGEDETYTMTLVNSGDRIQVYDLVIDAGEGLNVDVEESIVVVPAGSSKIVRLVASASEEGKHSFTVNVHTEDGTLINSKEFNANVEGRSIAGNAAVLLTVVLAIIFIVLLIVLIVLLTRKPDKAENLGESYY